MSLIFPIPTIVFETTTSIGQLTWQLYDLEFSNISLIKFPQSCSYIDFPIL